MSMFSQRDLMMLRVAVAVKTASLKRGANTSREPQFKALFELELAAYNELDAFLLKEYTSHVQVSQETESRKKP